MKIRLPRLAIWTPMLLLLVSTRAQTVTFIFDTSTAMTGQMSTNEMRFYAFAVTTLSTFSVSVSPIGSGDPDLQLGVVDPSLFQFAAVESAGLSGADTIFVEESETWRSGLGQIIYIRVFAWSAGGYTLSISMEVDLQYESSPAPTNSLAPTLPPEDIMAGVTNLHAGQAMLGSVIVGGYAFYRIRFSLFETAPIHIVLTPGVGDTDLRVSRNPPSGSTFAYTAESSHTGSDAITLTTESLEYPTYAQYVYIGVFGYHYQSTSPLSFYLSVSTLDQAPQAETEDAISNNTNVIVGASMGVCAVILFTCACIGVMRRNAARKNVLKSSLSGAPPAPPSRHVHAAAVLNGGGHTHGAGATVVAVGAGTSGAPQPGLLAHYQPRPPVASSTQGYFAYVNTNTIPQQPRMPVAVSCCEEPSNFPPSAPSPNYPTAPAGMQYPPQLQAVVGYGMQAYPQYGPHPMAGYGYPPLQHNGTGASPGMQLGAGMNAPGNRYPGACSAGQQHCEGGPDEPAAAPGDDLPPSTGGTNAASPPQYAVQHPSGSHVPTGRQAYL